MTVVRSSVRQGLPSVHLINSRPVKFICLRYPPYEPLARCISFSTASATFDIARHLDPPRRALRSLRLNTNRARLKDAHWAISGKKGPPLPPPSRVYRQSSTLTTSERRFSLAESSRFSQNSPSKTSLFMFIKRRSVHPLAFIKGTILILT